jgi:hypothetical protein
LLLSRRMGHHCFTCKSFSSVCFQVNYLFWLRPRHISNNCVPNRII